MHAPSWLLTWFTGVLGLRPAESRVALETVSRTNVTRQQSSGLLETGRVQSAEEQLCDASFLMMRVERASRLGFPMHHKRGLEEELVYPSASECGVEVPGWHLAGASRAQNKSRPDTAKASAILVQDDGCGAAGVPILGYLLQFGVDIGAALVKP